MMQWSSAISEQQNIETALRECHNKIEKELAGRPDLCFAFVSPHYSKVYGQVPSRIYDFVQPKVFLGCSAGGIIGGGKEIEQKPAVSLTCAVLPEVDITPFRSEEHTSELKS